MTQEEFNKFDKDFEVCVCLGVCLEEIQESIKNGCDSIEAIMEKTEAGTVCEQCQSRSIDEDGDRELHIDEILKFTK